MRAGLTSFKRLAAKCAELVRTKDTGTLQYKLYCHDGNTECLVFERYRDSQATLEHQEIRGHHDRDSSDLLCVWFL